MFSLQINAIYFIILLLELKLTESKALVEADTSGMISFSGLEWGETWRRIKLSILRETKLAQSIANEISGHTTLSENVDSIDVNDEASALSFETQTSIAQVILIFCC